jgi:hypothetical protein
MTWFVCPHCKKPSEFDERTTDSVAPCPKCGLRFQLPSAPPLSIPASPAAGSVGIPDEDEATMRAEMPGAFFAGTEALGRPRYRVEGGFQTNDRDKLGSIYLVFGLLALALPPLCVLRIKDYFFHRNEAFAPGEGFPWFAFFAMCVALPAGLWLCRAAVRVYLKVHREGKSFAVVWTEGFVHFDGRRFILWRWADIAVLNMQDIDKRTLVLIVVLVTETNRQLTKYYRLRHRDGAEYRLWNTQGSRAAQFGYQVEQETFRRMMADTIAQVNGGKTVPFSPFEVKVNGLVYGGQFTAWADIRPASFDRGRLRLEGVGTAGSAVSILLEKIDNSHVFLRLLEQNVGFKQPS